MKKLCCLLLFAVISFSAQNSFEGIGHQNNDDSTWKFTMDRIDETSFKVVYPELKCASIWKLKKTEGDFKIYQEKLTSGLDKCVDGGFIYIVEDMMGSSTQYFYIYDKMGGLKEVANGTIDIVED